MTRVPNRRYIQIAFNRDLSQVRRILPRIPYDPRILIEAGTPFCKREGMNGVRFIRRLWRGLIVADLKVTDGASQEVAFAAQAGASAVTASGSSPTETLDIFNSVCQSMNVYSMIDMLGVDKPLRKIMPLKTKPGFVVIHKGRDEESNKLKLIRYKDIGKIRSKFEVLISVAGGLEPENIRSAYFNGSDVGILNVVGLSDQNKGILENSDFRRLIPSILQEVGN